MQQQKWKTKENMMEHNVDCRVSGLHPDIYKKEHISVTRGKINEFTQSYFQKMRLHCQSCRSLSRVKTTQNLKTKTNTKRKVINKKKWKSCWVGLNKMFEKCKQNGIIIPTEKRFFCLLNRSLSLLENHTPSKRTKSHLCTMEKANMVRNKPINQLYALCFAVSHTSIYW